MDKFITLIYLEGRHCVSCPTIDLKNYQKFFHLTFSKKVYFSSPYPMVPIEQAGRVFSCPPWMV